MINRTYDLGSPCKFIVRSNTYSYVCTIHTILKGVTVEIRNGENGILSVYMIVLTAEDKALSSKLCGPHGMI